LRQESYNVHLYFGDVNGTFTKRSENFYQYSTYPFITTRNKAVDLDSDGLVEWIGPNRYCNGVSDLLQLCIREYDAVNDVFIDQSITGASHYEYGVVAVGDVNGDGYNDIVSSNRRTSYYDVYRGTLQQSGQVWVFYGSATGISAADISDADWTAYGDNAVTTSVLGFGINLAVADVNGDGIDDLAVTSFKGTFLFYGPLQTFTDANGDPRDANSSDADAIFLHLSTGVANVGDQNGDGYDDLLVGGNCNNKDHNDTYISGACGTSVEDIYLFNGAAN